ncbi:MAG: thioredoxin domain-containing protein [Deltaproteobacteria bacterium]|nr:thioredoxin domain-containing protein [Deltaproteobacteria bacterium]
MPDQERTNREGRRRGGPYGWLVAGALFALAGVIASGMAWRTHWVVRSQSPAFQPACSISETVDCAKAVRSGYAVVLRVPIALWSGIGFTALLGCALVGLKRRPAGAPASGLFFALAALAAVVSVVMFVLSRVVLGIICPECTGIQVLSLLVLVCAALQLREVRLGPVRALAADLRALRGRPRLSAGLVLAGALGVALLIAFYPQHHWTPPPLLPGLPAEVGRTPLAGPEGLPTGRTADGDPYIGAAEARLTIVELSDYECPFCAHAHRVLREFVRRHPDRLRLVHRHLPLDRACNPALGQPFHGAACAWAAAAVCAGEQGRFWEMNDVLFELQAEARQLGSIGVAERAGVPDPEAFLACLGARATAERLVAEVVRSVEWLRDARLGLATPAFELRVGAETVVGRYVGFGGDRGVPEDVVRRLYAGWPDPWTP